MIATRRLGQLGRVRVSNVDKHSVPEEQPVRLCNYTDVYYNESITHELPFMEATASPTQVREFNLQSGDTVFTKDSETADDIGIPAYIESSAADLVCGYHLAIFRPGEGVHPKFMAWALRSRTVLAQWEVLATGVTRVGLKQRDIRRVEIPLPPLPEQRAIADFLDRETARIDVLIEKQTKMIDRLRERRVAMVSEATCRGIDGAPLRSSEIQWQGEVPDHWTVGPIRRLMTLTKEQVGGAWSTTQLLSLTKGGVIERDPDSGEGKFPASFDSYQLVAPDDLVFCLFDIDETPRAVGRATQHGMVTGAYTRYAVKRSVANPHYLEWAFIGIDDGKRLRPLYTGLRKVIQKSRFAAASLALPPLEEQRRIAAYLDRETAKIDTLIAKTERMIELSRERRSALITAAVTGQIDVTKEG